MPHLGHLEDPSHFVDPLKIDGQDARWLKDGLAMMLLIRAAEEKIADLAISGEVVCPVHLAIGQEAAAVGVARHLRNTDRVFGTHRSHAHFLSMGGSVDELFAEVLGKKSGCSGGMGGSMHLYSRKHGFSGSVPIVGATISLATGAALAAHLDGLKTKGKKNMDVGVAYFGDGAVEEGTFHESMNYAKVFRLPMIFVCENNFMSSHLHIKLRQPDSCVARYAKAHCMAYEVVDGNDVVAVAEATKRLTDLARSGEGPGFLEAITYRWRGHVGPREDIDVGVARSQKDVDQWRRRDPVGRLQQALVKAGKSTDAEFAKVKEEAYRVVAKAAAHGLAAPYPEISDLLDLVYPKKEVRKNV